ncbi:hypothetical protein A2954_01805 [Candidatus Roizmanbacteria bacterium RIFCSPLOWO2_01_FULL_37_12]|uniref:Nudix hydrolase domain-containing protein n=1 Tax=Candidatus Roizmanbacteria bacterium RIFCSPLOWO2_01_FULL_37_12 TaxID=1802056 RepID=A0A1F7I9J2_9BACT|nr:MAG: hypothetical protein A2768_01105 [Candidatus Roizmanbacteria bacterium RIFCSPHIGHO2_01_FULL_37_16]OGK24499.1 MAG: hypothetical protein A3D76_05720 [Candidatus Roizmanbacteria bacterium RIFCSPHIGHO2_02_FULL_37_9b]OGK39982.1 MAG: hypothetical protein A2954_01805 [Candidatus Roizmanbacteria bacterium RIFCSPLOWO2_01_FULL_37_12]
MTGVLENAWRILNFTKNLQVRIMRFLNDEFLVGVTGIIFNNKNKVLLVKHTYRNLEWSLPGGYLKAKEHPTEGLEREILEETGFTVSIDKLLKIRTDRETGRLDMCYFGTFIGGDFKKNNEVVDFQFCEFDQLPVLIPDQVLFIKQAYEKRKQILKHLDNAAQDRNLNWLRKLLKNN